MSQNTPDLATAGSVPPDDEGGAPPTPLQRTGATPGAGPAPAGEGSAVTRLLSSDTGRTLGLVAVLVLIVVAGVATAGSQFASVPTAFTILNYAAVIGVVSIGMTFVITGGGIDLSVGSLVGLSSIWASTVATQTIAAGSHWAVMVFTAVAVGAVAGLVTGAVVAYGKVVAFIATLAMLIAARGLAELIAQNRTQVLDPDTGYSDALTGRVLGVPVLIWVFALVSLAGWFLLNRTTFGRRTVAVGGNPEAARLAGIKVQRHTMYLYALSGTCAGLGGAMILARVNSGSSTNGTLYELDAIAAVVIGGTLLAGGRGTVLGTVLGVLIFATLQNVFVQNNLSISTQSIAKGAIIVVAVLLQQRLAARRAPRRAG
ncbi:ABC transporter permease [Pseudokineococcus marinus]|uniref:ABC transporter permease n=1 Tax=Pseudokineococcus marinus TaxID=351215 RepID=A0A849BHF8_9ACTN|nr:ABC transporter permease [Pseudokineococcus marinus]NNH22011.1 ABC transporter permease [Pseudokineococcus marinus]